MIRIPWTNSVIKRMLSNLLSQMFYYAIKVFLTNYNFIKRKALWHISSTIIRQPDCIIPRGCRICSLIGWYESHDWNPALWLADIRYESHDWNPPLWLAGWLVSAKNRGRRGDGNRDRLKRWTKITLHLRGKSFTATDCSWGMLNSSIRMLKI